MGGWTSGNVGFRLALGAVLAGLALATHADNGGAADGNVTLMVMGDLHGTLVPHQYRFSRGDGSEYDSNAAGGLANLKTVVDGVRAEVPDALLLSCGDLTHGSAETMFTVGDAIMPAINAFGISAFTPGNWDFGYGPAVFRSHFTPASPPLPPNIQVMARSDGVEGITKAAFPTVAINLYDANPGANFGKRLLPPYQMYDVGQVKVAIIGITAAIVPQQADTFNIGLRFTQGVEELPGILDEVRTKGADLIVVQSELGLSQNIEIARRFKDIDVMYSAHTHEITHGALLADPEAVTRTTPGGPLSGRERSRLAREAAIVVETDRDHYVGRLDLHVAGKKVVDFSWEPIPVDGDMDHPGHVVPNTEMAALVAAAEENFVAGSDGKVMRHVFLPGGYAPGGYTANPLAPCNDSTSARGLQLCDDLDTIVGSVDDDTILRRRHVLEHVLNNFVADALRKVSSEVAEVDLSVTNGFRFGTTVLPASPILLRDLYTWFPIAAAVAIADYSGSTLEKTWDDVLSKVFDRNPFLQQGGWYLGFSSNIEQKIDLDHRPFSSSSGRIVETRIDTDGTGKKPLDPSRRYVMASCYGHGDPLGSVCRTDGGANVMFPELVDIDDYSSALKLVPPVNEENVIVGTTVKQVAPDAFLHPVHVLWRYLDESGGVVRESDHAVGRVKTVDSTLAGNPPVAPPVSQPDPTLIQPPQGAGPTFFSGRIGE